MNEEQRAHLTAELKAFGQLNSGNEVQVITDAYNAILATVQRIMLGNANPDGRDRAWSLLKDDAFKNLTAFREGNQSAFEDLKVEITQVGHLLLGP